MNIYHCKCHSCITEFVGINLLYCPFCASSLRQQGKAEYTVRDYIVAGWNAIAFRSKAGFIVKDTFPGS